MHIDQPGKPFYQHGMSQEKIAELEAQVVACEAMEAERQEKIERILRSGEVRRMRCGDSRMIRVDPV